MRRTLPIALAASAGAAVSAAPAHAYESVNAATRDGHNDPKPPKPQPAPRSQPEPKSPPPRQAAPPPQPDPAPLPVATAVDHVAKSVKQGARSLEGNADKGTHEPRHQPQIGRQPNQAPAPARAPAPASVTALSHEGYDKPTRERGDRQPPRREDPPKRHREQRHRPPTSSVTALSHETYDPQWIRRQERQEVRRERRELRADSPNRGPKLSGYQAPVTLGDEGRRYTVDSGCVRRLTGGYPCRRSMPKTMRRSVSHTLGQSVVLSRSGETVAMNGRRYQTLTLTSDKSVTVGVDAAIRKVAGGLAFSRGTRHSWEAVVRAPRADRLADGRGVSPDPRMPGTLRTGEGVLIRDDDYTASHISGMLRFVGVGDRHLEADRATGGVQRLNDRRLRVYVGDEDVVEEVMSLGVGLPGAQLTQQISRSFASGKLHSVDIRVGTPGGTRSYQRYLETGVLPRVKRAGVGRERFLDTATWGSSSGPGVELLGQSAQKLNSENGGEATTIHRPGREDIQTLRNHMGDVTVDHSFVRHSGGVGRGSRYSMLVENSDPNPLNQLLDLHGQDAGYGEDQDVRLSFSGRELRAVRQQAIDRIAVNQDLDPDSVEQQIMEDPDDSEVEGLPFGWQYELGLASSRHPADILGEMYTRSWGNSDKFYDQLNPVQLMRLRACIPPGRLKVLGPSDTG